MGTPPAHPAPSKPNSTRRSITTKLFVIMVLAGALIIPAMMITELVSDRARTRDAALAEISSTWGYPQRIMGPVLTVPYRQYDTDTAGRRVNQRTRLLHVLPERLDVRGVMHPEVRYRGMYEAVLYRSEIMLSGQFARLNVDALGIRPEDVNWGDAYVTLGIPDMRGVRDRIELVWDRRTIRFQPGVSVDALVESQPDARPYVGRDGGVHYRPEQNEKSGVTAALDSAAMDTSRARHEFSIRLSLNGSGRLTFIPLGRETSVEVRSTWASPSFDGAFLPTERRIDNDGFLAKWKVLDLNRGFPQIIREGTPQFGSSEFGVRLVLPADNYQQTMRSVKYAALFIVLTFLAFFLIEVLERMRVHPIQYLLVGCALVLFYLLLLSASEYLTFAPSYLIAAGATVLLVALYVASVFRRLAFTTIIAGVLSLLYGYLFVLLQLEDYSLLLGSIGLFVILGAVMYLTRKIDWYAVGGGFNGAGRETTAVDVGASPSEESGAVVEPLKDK